VAATLLGALLAPATGVFASDHGGHLGRHHGRAQQHHPAQKHHQQKVFLGGHKLEGEAVIVSVAADGSSMVLRPTNSDAVTATVTISSSTVITADEGVTTTTLAAGERVHVVVVDAGGSQVAQIVVIESVDATGDVKGDDDHGPKGKGGHGGDHHGQAEFEGVIVSVAADGSSFVLQRPNSPNVTATITISSSTVITADEGVTTTTLAAGEQVHVKAQQVNGVFVATRIEIQKPEANGDHNPGGSGDDDDQGQGGTGNPGNAGPGNGNGHGDHSGGPGAGDHPGNGGHDSGGTGPGGA
jgi:hypothetical protein